MKRRFERPETRALLFRAVAIIVSVIVFGSSFAAAPAWWSTRGVLLPNTNADDHALVNQGQLKNIAAAAVAEMDAKLTGGAGNDLHNLIDSWATPTAQTNDYAPLNLGQLKNTAKPFYDRLIAAGLSTGYPWTGNSNAADDFAVANMGQVKNLFSFSILADDLTIGVSGGASQSTTPGNFLPLPISVVVNSSNIAGGLVDFAVTNGDALLATDNSGTQTPSTTIRVPVTYEFDETNTNQIIVARVYVYLPPTASGASVIQATASSGGQTASVSTGATALDPSTLSPPTDFTVTATSPTTSSLSWTVSASSVPTTLQESYDNGATWRTVGVTGPGVNFATVTGMTPGQTVSFRAFTGGIYPAGGGSTLPAPSPSGPSAPIPPSPTTTPSTVTPLSYPTIKGETVGYGHYKNGRPGFLFSTTHNYYLTETKVISTESQDESGNWAFSGSTTTTSTFDPITGQQTTQPPVIVGGGGYEVELYGGILTTVSDSLKRLIGTGYPGDRARSTYTDTLSNIYTTEMLVQNVEARVPAFRNQFTISDNWAYIYLDSSGSAYDVYKLQYKWQANAAQTPLVVWDEVFTPYDANGNWNPGANGENIKHNIKRWVASGTADSPVYGIDPTQQNNKHNGYYEVLLVQIELADPNQTGVGAMVPSIKTDDTQQKHFVTPKQAGGSLTFHATLGDSSNDFDLLYEWHVPSGVTVAGDTVTVPRDIPDKYTIELRIKGTSTVVDTLNVWVVWTEITATSTGIGEGFDPWPFTVIEGGYHFAAEILPASILAETDDIPALKGKNGVAAPGGKHLDGSPLSGGAKLKWDISRQTRQRKSVPNGWSDLRFLPPPSIYGDVNDYPANPVEGNDDAQTGDEDDDPYNAPNLGKLTSEDNPVSGVSNLAGQLGDVIVLNIQFREFCRLNIGDRWYLISDYFPWRFKQQFRRITTLESTVGIDLNGDGDLLDTVPAWRNDGSAKETNNNEW